MGGDAPAHIRADTRNDDCDAQVLGVRLRLCVYVCMCICRLYVYMSSETEPFRCVKPKRRSRITHVGTRDDLINRSCPSEPDWKPETASERNPKVISG